LRLSAAGEVRGNELKPANAVILAVAHEPFRRMGWELVQRLLVDGQGVVADVRNVLPRKSKPEGITLWRL
jgi:UDP-N-acetyl-D-galactosamine dehydrogenase